MLTLAILGLPLLTEAYASFKTNCTLPSDSDQVNYVSSPDTRGTLNIAWSCIFTIIACTWTVQSPNVPWQREHYRAGRWGWWKWTATKYASLAGWFFATMIAPEFLLMKYLGDYLQAKKNVKDFQKYAEEDGVQWTASHYHFARMGGFVMRTHVKKRKPRLRDPSAQIEAVTIDRDEEVISQNPTEGPPQTGEEHRDHHGIDREKGHESNVQTSDKPNPYFLQPQDILTLREKGVLRHLPRITQEEVQDRSKADGLMRAITVVQILWLCIQVIARAAEGLSVTQLEISTTAFAICAVFMYALGWDKPKGIQIPITILRIHDNGEKAHALLLEEQKEDDPFTNPVHQYRERALGYIAPNTVHSHWGLVIIGMIFGGVHLTAWNFTFPTDTECLLWRVASIYCTGFPPCFTLMNFLSATCIWFELKGIREDRYHTVILSFWLLVLVGVVYVLSTLFYVVARLYLLVEMFRTLAYQPADAYKGTWAVNIPYIS